MRSWSVWLLLGTLCSSNADPLDFELVLQDAWTNSSQARQADLAVRRAGWDKERADHRWWPTLSLEANVVSQASVQTSGVLGLSLVQKLPGGGQLSLGGTVKKELPVASLGLILPLMAHPRGEIDSWTWNREVLGQQVVVYEGFLAVVRAASEQDLARRTLVWRQALEEVALVEVGATMELSAQGRGTASDLWKAQRKAESQHWERVQAETLLRRAQSAWGRISMTELPLLEDESLDALLRSRDSDPYWLELNERITVVQRTLDRLQTQAERSFVAPSVKLSLSGTRPVGSSWSWEGQIGVSLGTDFWVVDEVLTQRQAVVDQRWGLVLEAQRRELSENLAAWESQDRDLEEASNRLKGGLEKMRETRDSLQILVQRQAVPRSEALAAEAEILALTLDLRRLAWQRILIAFQQAPPVWLFR